MGSYFDVRSFDGEIKSTKEDKKLDPHKSGKRVLVVDDSRLVTRQISQILSDMGYEVVATCSDGREGADKYKELFPNIDLVTMDITMPRLDGICSLREILAFDPNAKVVMVSAMGKQEQVKEALMAGAKNFIIKPLSSEKVLERIASL